MIGLRARGNLHKMHTAPGSPVAYSLELGGQRVEMNALLGEQLRLEYLAEIACVHCGRPTRKSFNQGYCYPCFRSLAQCDICIVSPEKCHYHLGTCREPEWGETHCMRPHIVYLANTSGVKVGITREVQLPHRWYDQGAVQALPIFRVSKRYHAGLIEHAFRMHVSDKTNWRSMLKNAVDPVDLYAVFEACWREVEPRLDADLLADVEVIAAADRALDLEYPARAYPQKIVSLNLDKQVVVEGRLDAIKGQYLLLDSGVINIRKYAGYLVELSA